MTGEAVASMRITITNRVYESGAYRVSPDGISKAGSGRSLYLLGFVIFSGAVCGQDDLEGTQTVEPARARRFAFGDAAQEVCEHERVHVLSRVRPRRGAGFMVESPQRLRKGVHVEDS